MPRFVFKVPNNEEGRLFIKLFRKYLNRDRYGWVRYSRGPRKNEDPRKLRSYPYDTNHKDLKIPYGKSWVVYLVDKVERIQRYCGGIRYD